MHVDMDYFFAAIEIRENQKLEGKPVVVGAAPKRGRGRGVVSTCNYDARKFGIHSGMPISRAYRLCPFAKFLPVNFPLYERVSGRIMEILRKYADKFESWGIDEAFLDASGRVKNFDEAAELARKIKGEIKEKENLTCSIGVGPNKTIAKIASGFQKPDGLTVVPPSKVQEFLNPLPVGEIPGIGPKSEQILAGMGVRTIGQLARVNEAKLVEEFGKWGHEMWERAHGIDESEVTEEWVIKSIGREHTFEKDTKNLPAIARTLREQSKEIDEQLKEEGFAFQNVTLKIRFTGFETHTRAKTLKEPTTDVEVALSIGKELLKEFIPLPKAVRLIGLRVAKLTERKK